MFKFISDVVKAVVNFIYGAVNDVVNIITGRGASFPPWNWTVNSDASAPQTNNEIDNLIKAYMQQHGVKAGQCSVFVNGNLTMSSAYTWGESDYPITKPDSVMRVASCSKAFTTAAILDLMDPPAGIPLLREGDKVFDILLPPSTRPFPLPVDPRVKDITVKHLLEHTGGWNYRTGPSALGDWVFHLKEIGRDLGMHTPPEKEDFARYILCNVSLDFNPGTRPSELFTLPGEPVKPMDTYSNIGYVLLGMLVDEKASSFIVHLNSRVLRSLSITDVAVGKTRQADMLPNEVLYESPYSGPDATRDPFDAKPAPLPYGGDGSRKEVMDSGGGLIMSANSLAKFISQNNVSLGTLDPTKTISQLRVRQMDGLTRSRNGSMPGTQAVGRSFQEKGGSKLYDMAVIFNKQDTSKNDPGDDSNDFDRLVRHLDEKIREVF
jgi:CubicO group peptidase (beta-lactamase class C family)